MNAWFTTSFLINEELCPDKGAALDRSLRVPCEQHRIYKMLSKDMRNKHNSTLFAHIRPQALQRVLGPSGPRRIIGATPNFPFNAFMSTHPAQHSYL
ncbi:hypothetical protein CR513_47444, partial [Mucuna pruriens]